MKRPSLQYSVACLGVEERYGPPCFNYVFYRLPLSQFPYQFPAQAGFFIVNAWCNGQGAFHQQLTISSPQGKVLVDTGARAFELADPQALEQQILYLQGFLFPEPGFYSVKVFLEGQQVLEYWLEAYLSPDAPAPEAP